MRVRTIDIPDNVADILRASTWDGPVLKLPPGQLDRKLYEAVNKVLTALGGKWNRHRGGHVFHQQAGSELAAALDTGSIVDEKKTFEQFFTPEPLAHRMAALADIRPGMKVLEPSAGDGALIRAAIAAGARNIYAYEINDKLREKLRNEFPLLFERGLGCDFMKPPATPIFDRILMNPPFSGGQDMAHVRHAFGFLKPGGIMVAIMSPHFTFADDAAARTFRLFLGYPDDFRLSDQTGVELGGIGLIAAATVERLPEGTFKSSGTMVSSMLVTIRKVD